MARFPTFGAVIHEIINSAPGLSQNTEYLHLVLDYIEMSLKEGEGCDADTATNINIINMNKNTTIPQHLDTVLASRENKQNLQLLVRDMVCNQSYYKFTLIASSVVSEDEVLPA